MPYNTVDNIHKKNKVGQQKVNIGHPIRLNSLTFLFSLASGENLHRYLCLVLCLKRCFFNLAPCEVTKVKHPSLSPVRPSCLYLPPTANYIKSQQIVSFSRELKQGLFTGGGKNLFS